MGACAALPGAIKNNPSGPAQARGRNATDLQPRRAVGGCAPPWGRVWGSGLHHAVVERGAKRKSHAQRSFFALRTNSFTPREVQMYKVRIWGGAKDRERGGDTPRPTRVARPVGVPVAKRIPNTSGWCNEAMRAAHASKRVSPWANATMGGL